MSQIQILIPITDVLFIILAMIDIFRQVQIKKNDGIAGCHNKIKLGQMTICFVGSSFVLSQMERPGDTRKQKCRQ